MIKEGQAENAYNVTIYACFIGYVVQAVVNNFVPLLFLTFQTQYHITLDKITLLVTFNFGVQLAVDCISAKYVDRIGYRVSIVLAHVFAAAGLAGLTVLPEVFPDPYIGILAAVMIYAVGGGLIEVLVSPIMEACPTKKKDAAMSLLHSFYCWGHVGVVLLSTLFFKIAGIENWKILAAVWAVIPVMNGFLFWKAPIAPLAGESAEGLTPGSLFRNKVFWVLMLLMVCAGACEQGISQWASAFAEAGLGVGKSIGDLAGPLLFAVLMGTSRALYGKFSEKIRLQRFMAYSGILCLASYLIASLAESAVFALMGCALCGLSVGILWPGTFSIAAAGLKNGGTALFAFLALAGDVGCAGGPTFVGFVSDLCGEDLKRGILAGVVFPVLLLIGLFLNSRLNRKENAAQA